MLGANICKLAHVTSCSKACTMRPFTSFSGISVKLLKACILGQLIPSAGLACLEGLAAHSHILHQDVPRHIEAALSVCSALLALLTVLIILFEMGRKCLPASEVTSLSAQPLEEEDSIEVLVAPDKEDPEDVWTSWRLGSQVSTDSVASLTDAMSQLNM